MNLKELNMHSWEMIDKYQRIPIYGKEVVAPYFINEIQGYFVELLKRANIDNEKIKEVVTSYKDRKIPFGWYRGKGTPEELAEATIQISEQVRMYLQDSSPAMIREFMKMCGLGIDCSGLVYQTLLYSFSKVGKEETFIKSLNWKSDKKDVYNAGTFSFDFPATNLIQPENIQLLDFILIRGQSGSPIHIALILLNETDLKIIQSAASNVRTGINISSLQVVDGKPIFDYKPDVWKSWEELYDIGKLEFRRLKFIDESQ